MNYLRATRRKANTQHKESLFYGRALAPCHYCQWPLTFEQATLDHMTPLILGGTNALVNKVICCERCNIDKGATPYLEYLQKVQRRREHGDQFSWMYRQNKPLIAHRVKPDT